MAKVKKQIYVMDMIEKKLVTLFKTLKINGTFKLGIPPHHVPADMTLTVIARGGSPKEIAKKFAQLINDSKIPLIEKAHTAGPFVNISFDKQQFYHAALASILEADGAYGTRTQSKKETVVVEYSSPNIAKEISVGHFRATIIGQAIANLYEALGYHVLRVNYLGDWGTQFGKLLYAFQRWGEKEKLERAPIKTLKDLYVRFHAEEKHNPALTDEARHVFQQLESGDEHLLALWQEFRALSITDFEKIYTVLNVHFDHYLGESECVKDAKKIIAVCLEKKIARHDPESGAIVVEGLTDDQGKELPSFLLQKSDGSTLYHTRDLAGLIARIKNYKAKKLIYVVGNEQELYFRQLFALAKKLGHLKKETATHVGFGLVLHEGKKMSTRAGTTISVEELIQRAITESRVIIQQKKTTITPEELDSLATTIGLSAITYNDLRHVRTSSISFDWQKMLSLEGESATYLQYTYVRIQSILAKLDPDHVTIKQYNHSAARSLIFSSPLEFAIAKQCVRFPKIVHDATTNNMPHMVALYLEELAGLFNSFYNETSIKETTDQNLQQSRIILISTIALIIKKGLSLLNIQTVQKM